MPTSSRRVSTIGEAWARSSAGKKCVSHWPRTTIWVLSRHRAKFVNWMMQLMGSRGKSRRRLTSYLTQISSCWQTPHLTQRLGSLSPLRKSTTKLQEHPVVKLTMIENVLTLNNHSKADHLHSATATKTMPTLESASSKSSKKHSMVLKSQTVISTTQVQQQLRAIKLKLKLPSLIKTWKEESSKRTQIWWLLQLHPFKAQRWSMCIEQLQPFWNPIVLRPLHHRENNKPRKNSRAPLS